MRYKMMGCEGRRWGKGEKLEKRISQKWKPKSDSCVENVKLSNQNVNISHEDWQDKECTSYLREQLQLKRVKWDKKDYTPWDNDYKWRGAYSISLVLNKGKCTLATPDPLSLTVLIQFTWPRNSLRHTSIPPR